MKKTLALIVALLVLASPLVLTLPWKSWMQDGLAVRQLFAGLGPWSSAAFVLLVSIATALGVPRLVFCFLGGWLYGFEWGFTFSQAGSLLGAYALFVLARHTRPERLLQKFPKLRALSTPVGHGWLSVLVVRQLPLAGLYNDILLAWSPVSHRDFWIGSFIGFMPLGVIASLAGAGSVQTDLSLIGQYLAVGTLAFLGMTAGIKWLVRGRAAMKADLA